jgi:Ca-activated chloride channel family protein
VAKIAKDSLNVKIYTIGVGRNGPVPFPNEFGILEMRDVKFDETTLESIAQVTDGKYFHAKSENDLTTIYQEIDKMERSKLSTTIHKTTEEKFQIFALIALICFLLEFFIKYTILRRFP